MGVRRALGYVPAARAGFPALATLDAVRGRMPGRGRWRVWVRWSPWRGSRASRPLERLLDVADLDIDPLVVVWLLVALPLLALVAAEQAVRLLATPVALAVRLAAGLPWPVEIAVRRRGWDDSMVLARDLASARRIRFGVAAHLGAGRDLADPGFQRWLADNGGLFVPDRRLRLARRLVRAYAPTLRPRRG